MAPPAGTPFWHWSKRSYHEVASDREAREPSDGRFEYKDSMNRKLRPEDRIHCTRCRLRGHVAGDPDRCIQPISLRLGESDWED